MEARFLPVLLPERRHQYADFIEDRLAGVRRRGSAPGGWVPWENGVLSVGTIFGSRSVARMI